MRKLLGKEVKIGTKVRTRDGKEGIVEEYNFHLNYPFGIRVAFSTWTVNQYGLYDAGSISHRDIVEVLEETPIPRMSDECADISTELELKNYRLTLENELLAQKVQSLAQEVQELRTKVKQLESDLNAAEAYLNNPFPSCPGCVELRQELDRTHEELREQDGYTKRIVEEVIELRGACLLCDYKAKAERYKKILKGESSHKGE